MSNALIKKRPDNDVAIVGNEGGLPTVRLLSPEEGTGGAQGGDRCELRLGNGH